MVLVCLGKKGYPTDQHAVDFNTCKEGFDILSLCLRDMILNLADTGNDVQVCPPVQDLSKIQQERS